MKERGVILLAFSIIVISFLSTGFATTGFVTQHSTHAGEYQYHAPPAYYATTEICDLNEDGRVNYHDTSLFVDYVQGISTYTSFNKPLNIRDSRSRAGENVQLIMPELETFLEQKLSIREFLALTKNIYLERCPEAVLDTNERFGRSAGVGNRVQSWNAQLKPPYSDVAGGGNY